MIRNQVALPYLEQALFAVQVVAGYAGVEAATKKNVRKLCDEVETGVLNGIFVGFTDGTEGDRIKRFVCDAADG